MDSDTMNRLAILRERTNPNQETVSGEATQTLNPLTGRPYIASDFSVPGEFDLLLFYDSIKTKGLKSRHIFSLSLPEQITNETIELEKALFVDSLFYHVLKPRQTTNEAIELQKALGRMEVREGKLPDFLYLTFIREVRTLAEVYTQNPALTLDSITDVNGLNVALWAMKREREVKKAYPFYSSNRIIKEPSSSFEEGVKLRGMIRGNIVKEYFDERIS